MPRSYAATDIVDLPRLDAVSALALATVLETAAADQEAHGATFPDAVKDARADMATDREALQVALGGSPTEADVRAADKDEDAGVGALYDLLRAWARLAGRIPQGDTAQVLIDRLFSKGIAFVNIKADKEWGIVDTKLKVIADENLMSKFDDLGAVPVLMYLQKVHDHYGEVTGMTKPAPAESPQVGEKLDALLDSMRHYVTAVTGSVRKKLPETTQLADALLKPLVDWKSAPPKPKTPKAQPLAKPPEGGETKPSNG